MYILLWICGLIAMVGLLLSMAATKAGREHDKAIEEMLKEDEPDTIPPAQ